MIIPSVGRAEVLGETLNRIKYQTRPPAQVLLVVCEPSDVPEDIPESVTVVFSEKGITAQRNKGIANTHDDIDYLLFTDDDAFIHPEYIERLERLFDEDSSIAGLTGTVIKDGNVSAEAADGLLGRYVCPPAGDGTVPCESLYGCNFGVRKSTIGQLRFDERLVLYGWLEDEDFSFNLGKLGDLRKSAELGCVHLMYPSGGRANHVRFGFSQVMNPYYLCIKNKRSFFGMMKSHWLKGVPANLFGAVFGPERVRRIGRLHGNLIAFGAIVRGRIDPEIARKL